MGIENLNALELFLKRIDERMEKLTRAKKLVLERIDFLKNKQKETGEDNHLNG